MKVTLYGASGTIGSRILNELIVRGHQVKAVVRDVSKIRRTDVIAYAGDILNVESVAAKVKGADAVISAYSPPPAETEKLSAAVESLIAGMERAHVARLLVVGGAGSLEVAPGIQLLDTPEFPEKWKPIATAHRAALDLLKRSNLDWTCLSPSAIIEAGERTGAFRIGEETLLVNRAGQSRISAEDYAMAMVDELEQPRHKWRRFTVGY